jgi:hypothetical protein
VRSTILVSHGITFPPALGEQVGAVELRVGRLQIRRVPLLVTGVPGPSPPHEPGPWWRRAFSSVTGAVGGLLDALLG